MSGVEIFIFFNCVVLITKSIFSFFIKLSFSSYKGIVFTMTILNFSFNLASKIFDIPYNRQQLADYLGVDRSALSSELSRMQKDGIISYYKNTFKLLQ